MERKDHPSKEFMITKLHTEYEIQPTEAIAHNLAYGLGYITFKTRENLHYIFIVDVFIDDEGAEEYPKPADIDIQEFIGVPLLEETRMTVNFLETYTLIGVNNDIDKYKIEYIKKINTVSIFHILNILEPN